MRNIFQQVIARGGYDLHGILKRIDEYHVEGKLSDADRAHLIAAARGDAAPVLDTAQEVQRLWQEVRALNARVEVLEGKPTAGGNAGSQDNAAEYVQPTGAHDAYFAGDVVTYKGGVYICIAPDGMACVWSPETLPAYWEALT